MQRKKIVYCFKTLKYGYENNQSHIINANYIVKRTKYFLSDANGHYLRIIIKIIVCHPV